jgi:hypothetical protein
LTFTVESQFISDDGDSAGGYTADPVVKDRDDGYIYFIFSNLRTALGSRGTLEFKV